MTTIKDDVFDTYVATLKDYDGYIPLESCVEQVSTYNKAIHNQKPQQFLYCFAKVKIPKGSMISRLLRKTNEYGVDVPSKERGDQFWTNDMIIERIEKPNGIICSSGEELHYRSEYTSGSRYTIKDSFN